jgi:hypothetical protein
MDSKIFLINFDGYLKLPSNFRRNFCPQTFPFTEIALRIQEINLKKCRSDGWKQTRKMSFFAKLPTAHSALHPPRIGCRQSVLASVFSTLSLSYIDGFVNIFLKYLYFTQNNTIFLLELVIFHSIILTKLSTYFMSTSVITFVPSRGGSTTC